MAKRHPSLIPLAHDHHHGLALALRCRKHALGQLNPGDRGSLEEFTGEVHRFFEGTLLPHFNVEEQIVFKLLSRFDRCRSVVADLENDHRKFRKQIDSHSADPRKFLFDFGDLLERHIRREERELFPMFEELVPAEEAERAGLEIKRALDMRSEQ